MPRFSVMDVFIGVTLIALGLAMFAVFFQAEGLPPVPLFFCGGALVGAGVLMPLKHPWIGALFGFVIMFPAFCAISLRYF